MKTNWKNKLKEVLKKDEFSEISAKTPLTKTDKTQMDVVSSVFVSGQLGHISEKTKNIEVVPQCSNCGLEMNLIENNTLWFCPLGCESRSITNEIKKDVRLQTGASVC